MFISHLILIVKLLTCLKISTMLLFVKLHFPRLMSAFLNQQFFSKNQYIFKNMFIVFFKFSMSLNVLITIRKAYTSRRSFVESLSRVLMSIETFFYFIFYFFGWGPNPRSLFFTHVSIHSLGIFNVKRHKSVISWPKQSQPVVDSILSVFVFSHPLDFLKSNICLAVAPCVALESSRDCQLFSLLFFLSSASSHALCLF